MGDCKVAELSSELEHTQNTLNFLMYGPVNMKKHCPVENVSVLSAEFKTDRKKAFIVGAKMSLVFSVTEESLNAGGFLFGGTVSSLADLFTTVLLGAADMIMYDNVRNSVSTLLQVEYLAPAALNENVRVDVTLERIGKDFLFSGAEFHNNESNALLYKARHQKKIFPFPKNRVYLSDLDTKSMGGKGNQIEELVRTSKVLSNSLEMGVREGAMIAKL